MNQTTMNSNNNEIGEEEINLLDYLRVLIKRRKMIVGMCVMAGILSIIYSLLATKIYTATAQILPHQSSKTGNLSSIIQSQFEGLGSLASGMLGGQSPVELCKDVLISRTVLDRIIEEHRLVDYYESDLLTLARNTLKDNTIINSSKGGVISISFHDKDPQMAATLANAYVDEVDRLYREVLITDAKRQRMFLEERLKEVKDKLSRAESDLAEFKKEHKAISLEQQAIATVDAAAKIQARIMSLETQLKSLELFAKEETPEIRSIKAQIDELRSQLKNIEWGGSKNLTELMDDEGNPSEEVNTLGPFIIFADLPDLAVKLSNLTREYKIQETLFGLLTRQYETAKIQEVKDTPTITVIDSAVPPEKRSKPKRKLIVILSTFTAFFISIFLAFIMEYIERVKGEQKEDDNIRYIGNEIKGDLNFFKERFLLIKDKAKDNKFYKKIRVNKIFKKLI